MEYSVLMTVYKNDNPEYLKKSIRSMINQTKYPAEIVIVKDGPVTSSLQAIIDSMNEEACGIINQIQLDENVGLGLALNEGLKVCKNDLVARMDADDISKKHRCEIQVREFEKDENLDIIGSSVDEFITNEDNIICTRIVPTTHDEIYRFSKQRDPFNHPTVMYKKSKVIQCGGYSNLRKNQDTDLWIKMLRNGCKTKNINESLLLFRFEEGTYERRKSWINTKLLLKIRYNAFKIGFSSFMDFFKVAIIQIGIYVMPIKFEKWIYKTFLRKNYEVEDGKVRG